jgi:hypothetical protein
VEVSELVGVFTFIGTSAAGPQFCPSLGLPVEAASGKGGTFSGDDSAELSRVASRPDLNLSLAR